MSKKKIEQNNDLNQNLEDNSLESIDVENMQFEEELDEELEALDEELDQEAEEDEEYELDFDFWQEALTSYGEIGSKQELKLILQKLNLDLKREKQKIPKIRKVVLARNKSLDKKQKAKNKSQKKLIRNMSAEKRLAFEQDIQKNKSEEKKQEQRKKEEQKQLKIEKKQELLDEKAYKAEFKRQEKIAIMSMVPQEKKEYLFQRNAKQKIDNADKRIQKAIDAQHAAKASKDLPIANFLYFVLGCVIVTAVASYCLTNIYLDNGYYEEKVTELKDSIAKYDEKLNGDMVKGLENIQTATATYNNILVEAPEMNAKLENINDKYNWVFEKETAESMGITAVEEKVAVLKTQIDKIDETVNARTSTVDNINRVYASDKTVDDMLSALEPYSAEIDTAKSEFSALEFPSAVGEYKDTYISYIDEDRQYYDIIVQYLKELQSEKDDMESVVADMETAMNYKPSGSSSFRVQVKGYYSRLDAVIDIDKAIGRINNEVEYAPVVSKKDFEFLVRPEIDEVGIKFYNTINTMMDIYIMSDKLESKCMDLPYPTKKATSDEDVIKFMTQNYSEQALEENANILEQLRAIEADTPSSMSNKVRGYITGLEIRGEFLELQKQYMDLEEEKNGYFLKVIEAENAYTKAKAIERDYRKKNGRDDEYDRLKAETDKLEEAIDDAEDIADDKAADIRETQKDLREDSKDLREDYSENLGYE